jgi:hypothetical protein
MAKRTRPRYKSGPKKGQFMSDRAIAASKGGRKRTRRKATTRRNPGRSVAVRKSNPPRRKRRSPAKVARRRPVTRRNPPKRRLDIIGSLMDGGIEAVQILVGKAAARSIPDLIRAPKEGNVGLAVQAATALVVGWGASMFLSPNAARAMLAGGLTAPIETLVVAYRVPWLSNALAPVTAANNVGAYARGRIGNGVSGYVRARPSIEIQERGLGGYVSSGDSGISPAYY